MEKNLSCSVVIHTEEHEGEQVYVAECEELGVSDFGDTLEEAIENLKKGLRLLIEAEPSKAKALRGQKPFMITKILL